MATTWKDCGLSELMRECDGSPQIAIGLIDGPVDAGLGCFADADISVLGGRTNVCIVHGGAACAHGTFVASMLVGKRADGGIAPRCRLVLRNIYPDADELRTTAKELAKAILECLGEGVRLINVSAAIVQSTRDANELRLALNEAAHRDVLVLFAAGNQNAMGRSPACGHDWIIPVVACEENGEILAGSNLGEEIARSGLRALGRDVAGMGIDGSARKLSGSSFAVPFVTGAAALLFSLYPRRTASEMRQALLLKTRIARNSLVPPLLDVTLSHSILAQR